MSTLLKDYYSASFYGRFADVLATQLPSFDKPLFLEMIFGQGFDKMELKERMRRTSEVMHHFLPRDYGKTVRLLEKIIAKLREEQFGEDSLVFMFLPDYIQVYGLEDYEQSVKAIELVTQFVSCEFAVRPFILKYGARMLEQMTAWSLHDNYKVRRLASEGTRPRLPWAMALPALKKEPLSVLPLLENLKNDPSEWVRRSVANSLNDIAKDNPAIVLDIARKWKGISPETDAIIKHGCRTLLKQGHAEILKHYGLESDHLLLTGFTVLSPGVSTGGHLEFSFSFINNSSRPHPVRLEYGVYYLRQNGSLSKKVFKISERIYQPGEQVTITRKQSFRPITTRKFYPGIHQLSVILNGAEKMVKEFVLEG